MTLANTNELKFTCQCLQGSLTLPLQLHQRAPETNTVSNLILSVCDTERPMQRILSTILKKKPVFLQQSCQIVFIFVSALYTSSSRTMLQQKNIRPQVQTGQKTQECKEMKVQVKQKSNKTTEQDNI